MNNLILCVTSVIPHILQQYPNMFLMRDLPLTKDMVLRGGDCNLEMLLQKRLVNEHNYLRILVSPIYCGHVNNVAVRPKSPGG